MVFETESGFGTDENGNIIGKKKPRKKPRNK
jgi:hypothetical protein